MASHLTATMAQKSTFHSHLSKDTPRPPCLIKPTIGTRTDPQAENITKEATKVHLDSSSKLSECQSSHHKAALTTLLKVVTTTRQKVRQRFFKKIPLRQIEPSETSRCYWTRGGRGGKRFFRLVTRSMKHTNLRKETVERELH